MVRNFLHNARWGDTWRVMEGGKGGGEGGAMEGVMEGVMEG